MIHLFNRKELLLTFKLEEQARVRDILAANGIGYQLKTVNRASPSPFSAGTRGRSGTFGLRTEAMYEYIFYVKKDDYDRALHLIHERQVMFFDGETQKEEERNGKSNRTDRELSRHDHPDKGRCGSGPADEGDAGRNEAVSGAV